ncbi:hypothetical protein ACR820_00085 [Streptomyces netropsis]
MPPTARKPQPGRERCPWSRPWTRRSTRAPGRRAALELDRVLKGFAAGFDG